jgi:hypothetical protein
MEFGSRVTRALALVAVIGCSSSSSSEPAPSTPPPAAPSSSTPPDTNLPPATPPPIAVALSALAVSTGDLVPAFSPSVTEYTLTANSAIFPVDVTASADATVAITVNGNAATAGVPLSINLAPRQDIVVGAVSSGASATYTIHFMPATIPAWSVNTIDPARVGDERILVTPGNRWLLMTNRAGDPLYYRDLTAHVVTDFDRVVLGGNTLYTFLTDDGFAHVLDDKMHETKTISLLANRDHGPLPCDIHDLLVLGDDHYVMLAYVTKTEDLSALNPAWAAAAPVVLAVVQEIDQGKVVFEWASSDLSRLYFDSADQNTFGAATPSDYLHINAVQLDPADGNFIVSLRHANSVLKLDHATGATLWTLGGRSDDFGLTAQELFSHQHHVRKQADGSFLVFDNGNDAHPTRVISFGLDEAKHAVTSFEVVYERPSAQIDSTYMGSAFRMTPSRHLIGWGGRTDTSSVGPSVTEVVDGDPVWTLTFTSPTVFSYRANPIPAN